MLTLEANYRIALRNLLANKTRSFLTLLGMVIGVAAVISIVSLGEGMKRMFSTEISKMGKDVVQIIPKAAMREGIIDAQGRVDLFNMGDVEALKSNAPLLSGIQAGMRTTGMVKRGDKSYTSIIEGGDVNFLQVGAINLQSGVGITEKDMRGRSRVAVIGDKVKNQLFAPFEDPLGKTIKVRDVEFTVIGVMEQKGGLGGGQGQDDFTVVPLSTMQDRIIGKDDVYYMFARVKDMRKVDEAKEEIRRVLRQRRHITDPSKEDFDIQTPEDWMKLGSNILNTMVLIFGAIAAFSLLVGGIGIMNIMLVSVAERTREIGLRMALGAQPRTVLGQFLLEAVLLTLIGGGVGLVLGYVFALGLSGLMSKAAHIQWPVAVPIPMVLITLAVSALFGIVFGIIPAYLASRKDPVEALRYE
jgi:putative ABC transport system permease protein